MDDSLSLVHHVSIKPQAQPNEFKSRIEPELVAPELLTFSNFLCLTPSACKKAKSPKSNTDKSSSPSKPTFLQLTPSILDPLTPRPPGYKLPTLQILPEELLHLITDFLDPEHKTTLALCNKLFYSIFGLNNDQVINWRRYRMREVRHEFLKRIERDLNHHVLCYSCNVLHDTRNTSPAACQRWRNESPSHGIPYLYKVQPPDLLLFFHKHFTFKSFQTAMKLNRFDCVSELISGYLKRLSRPYWGEATSCEVEGKWVKRVEYTARIFDGNFLWRSQQIFIRLEKIDPMPSFPKDLTFVICPHLYSTDVKHLIQDAIARRDFKKPFPWGNVLTKCSYCLTEFRIDFTTYKGLGHATTVTKWQDLGEGRSPNEPKWRSHIGGTMDDRSHAIWDEVMFDRGSIMARFEGKDPRKFRYDNSLSWEEKAEMRATMNKELAKRWKYYPSEVDWDRCYCI